VREGPKLAFPRPMPLAAALGDRLYVVGDSRGHKGEGSPVESIGAGETAWRREPNAPIPMETISGCVFNGKWHIWTSSKGILVFDPAAAAWTPFTVNAPHAGRAPEFAVTQGRLWVLGGRDVAKDVGAFVFDPAAKTWREGPDLPAPASWAACGEVNGSLIVAGGAAEIPYAKKTFTFANATYKLRRP
jgi:hypothetical protein